MAHSYEEWIAHAREAFQAYERDEAKDAKGFQRTCQDAFWGAQWLGSIVGTIAVMQDAVAAQALNEDLLTDESVKRALAQRGQLTAYRQVLSVLYQVMETEHGEPE